MKSVNLQRPLFHALLIILLGLIAYSNTFHVPFLLDDKDVIVENPIVKDLNIFAEPSKATAFKGHFEYHNLKTRYIGYLTFALNYKLHGLDVRGYHVVNLLIHISTALLVYILVVLTFKTPFLRELSVEHYSRHIAVFTAFLFVSHPVQTEAVTYIWQRVASLATMLYVLSLVSYIRWRLLKIRDQAGIDLPAGQAGSYRGSGGKEFSRYKSVFFYLISIIAAVAAMMTKQTAFTLPVIIILYEFMFFSEKIKKRIVYALPFLLTMSIIPLTIIDIQKPIGDLIGEVSGATKYMTDMSRWEYLFTEFRVIITYIRLIFLPVSQNLDYDYPVFRSFFDTEVFLSFILLAAIFGSAVYLFFRFRESAVQTRLIVFGILWFFITLSVESSVIPLINVINEYRVYMPSIGVFIAVCTSLFIGAGKLKGNKMGIESMTVLLLVVVTAVLTWTTYTRNMVWSDEVSLLEDSTRKSPEKIRPRYYLAGAYMSRGLIDKAVKHYETIIELAPGHTAAYVKLCGAYNALSRFNEAIDKCRTAIRFKPDSHKSYNNLGNAFKSKGLLDKAVEQYQTAIKLNPDFPEAHFNAGNAFKSKGLIDEAIEHYQTAVRLKPDYYKAYNNLGNAFKSKGLLDKAVEQYQTAIKLNPDFPEAHYNLSVAYKSKGLPGKAGEHYEKAIRLKKNNDI